MKFKLQITCAEAYLNLQLQVTLNGTPTSKCCVNLNSSLMISIYLIKMNLIGQI